MTIQEFKNKVRLLLPSNSFGSIQEIDFRTLFNDLVDLLAESQATVLEATEDAVRAATQHGTYVSPATSRLSRINNIIEISSDYTLDMLVDNTIIITNPNVTLTFENITQNFVGVDYTLYLFQPSGFSLSGDASDAFITASGATFVPPLSPCKITVEVITLTQFLCTIESVSDDKYYEIEFTNETSLLVTHNLGKQPSVTLLDTNGEEHEVSVDHIDNNSCTVSWNGSLSGKIICN